MLIGRQSTALYTHNNQMLSNTKSFTLAPTWPGLGLDLGLILRPYSRQWAFSRFPEGVERREERFHVTRPVSVLENEFIRNLHQRVQAIRRELPGKQIRISRIRYPKLLNQIRRNLGCFIRTRVPTHAICPIDVSERVPTTPIRILH